MQKTRDTQQIKEALEAIDWSRYRAAHGWASAVIEVDGEVESQSFLKRLFSGPPPKKKVGNVPELLEKLCNSNDEAESASIALGYLQPAILRDEFVAEAALPSLPFLLDALDLAAEKGHVELCCNLIVLLTGVTVQSMRNATVPRGDWSEDLGKELQANRTRLEECASTLENPEFTALINRLSNLLDKKPGNIIRLDQEINYIEAGEIRYIRESKTEALVQSLNDLGFKVARVDLGPVEHLESDLINILSNELGLLGSDENQPETIAFDQFVELILHHYPNREVSHLAIVLENLSQFISEREEEKERLEELIESLVVSTQDRDDSPLATPPIQREYFFAFDTTAFDSLLEEAGIQDKSTDMFCLSPRNPDYHRARAYREMDRGNLEEALGHYDRAIEISPDDFALLRERAQVNRLLKRYDQAVEDCTRAIELNDYSLAHCERARSYMAMGDFDSAIKDLEEEIGKEMEDEAESWVPHQLLAEAKLAEGDLEAAMKCCNRSLQIAVTRQAFETRARIHEQAGRMEESINDRAKAEETHDGDPGVL